METILNLISSFLNQPLKILIYGFIILLTTLLLNNTLFHIWHLKRDNQLLKAQTEDFQAKTARLKEKLKLTSTSSFIRSKVTQNLDFVKNDEIIFIFTDSSSKAKNKE